ncbi:MAG: hypothetical protein R3F34_12075 [Planctomycetota bacterium]
MNARAGHTLIETLIAVAIFPILVGACFISVTASDEDVDLAEERADMLRRADTAMSIVTSTLETTGWVSVGGVDYPWFVEEDDVDDPDAVHPHARAIRAEQGRTAREINVVVPLDADGDGWPDLDEDFEAIDWSPERISFALVPDGSGSNALERRVDGQPGRVIARNVRRFVVDDAASSGFDIPLDCLRVTLELQGARDARQTLRLTRIVRMPNGSSSDE